MNSRHRDYPGWLAENRIRLKDIVDPDAEDRGDRGYHGLPASIWLHAGITALPGSADGRRWQRPDRLDGK